jgi:hypothetical protein
LISVDGVIEANDNFTHCFHEFIEIKERIIGDMMMCPFIRKITDERRNFADDVLKSIPDLDSYRVEFDVEDLPFICQTAFAYTDTTLVCNIKQMKNHCQKFKITEKKKEIMCVGRGCSKCNINTCRQCNPKTYCETCFYPILFGRVKCQSCVQYFASSIWINDE